MRTTVKPNSQYYPFNPNFSLYRVILINQLYIHKLNIFNQLFARNWGKKLTVLILQAF